MKKVGVVTCYFNYGSCLQAYALKTFFEQNNCICEMITNRKPLYNLLDPLPKSFIKFSIIPYIYMRIVKKGFPYFFNQKFNIYKANFIKEYLHPKKYSMEFLRQLAKTDTFDYFFAGSDQIWRADGRAINKFNFLNFAPHDKKYAIAPSFGSGEIKEKNIEPLKEELLKFKSLTVRETKSKELIKKHYGLDAIVLSDPVTLFDRNFWNEFSKNGKTISDKYIFVHFISRISKTYAKLINDLAKNCNLKIVTFYNDANKRFLKNVVNIEGTPQDMVSLIKGAEYVFTDSFHTSQFSIIYNKKFFVIERNYKKGANEHTRLAELDNKFSCRENFLTNESKLTDLIQVPTRNYDEKFNYWSNLTKSYILNIIKSPIKNNVNNITSNLNVCINCKLCEQVCPKNAISFKNNEFLYPIPIVDTKKCINCGLCLKKCNEIVISSNITKHTGYIAYNKNKSLRDKSASGGMFSALATEFIRDKGIVYGAKLILDGKNSRAELTKAETQEELIPLLNSKYVECECAQVFPEIKSFLDKGRKVLVSNTSCKIVALYKYLGKHYPNLYTIDLICHGTPGSPLFAKYVEYIEEKKNGKINDFAFRRKNHLRSFAITAKMICGNRPQIYRKIAPKSIYFSLFLKGETYRECCYNCKYASINKPADITIGDYYEAKKDYPKFVSHRMIKKGLSSLITHNKHGEELIVKYGSMIEKILVDYKRIQLSHTQLCMPSKYSNKRFTFFKKSNLFD